jgi:hypothetical protein
LTLGSSRSPVLRGESFTGAEQSKGAADAPLAKS